MSRGLSGLFYVTGNSVTRVDSGYAGGGSGLISLNGLTASSQTFTNDANVTITSSGGVHTIGWISPLSVARGGTNATSLSNILGTANQVTVTNGSARVIGGNVTLSLPQNVDSLSQVAFGRLTFPSGVEYLQWGNYSAGAGILISPWIVPTTAMTMRLPTSGGTFATNALSPVALSTAGTIYLNGIGGYTANGVLGSNSGGTALEYKAFSNGTNINITHSPNLLTIGLTGTVAVANGGTGLSTLPGSNRVLASNTGGTAYIGKVVVGAGATTITNSNDTITITTSTASGEANTSSSVAGAGIAMTKAKVGVDLPFKRIKGVSPATVTEGTDSVLVGVDTAVVATQYDIPIARLDTVLAAVDTLAITVASVSLATASIAGTTTSPPIPLRCYVKNSTTIVIKFDYDLTVNQPVTIAYWR